MGENKHQSIIFQYSKIWNESAKISKKLNIYMDLKLLLAERKNGRNMQMFQIVIKGFVIKEGKNCFI